MNRLRRGQQGFSLLELGIVLALLAGLSMVLIGSKTEKPAAYSEADLLHIADKQLRSFMAVNGRLPCADTSGNGEEDCDGSAKGQLPFVTLGLNRQLFPGGDNTMRYSVYRNASNTVTEDADLAASNQNRFQPLRTNGEAVTSASVNNADFCQALNNSQSTFSNGFDNRFTFIDTVATRGNVAYALATPGDNNSDNVNGMFDGLNGSNPIGFNSSHTSHDEAYDDHVLSRTFVELKQELQCDLILLSLNLIAKGVQVEETAAATAASNVVSIVVGGALALAGSGLSAADLVLGSFDVVTSATKMAEAIAQLAAAIGTCIVGVGCTQIPRLVAAIATGVIGITLSAASLIAATVALSLQIVATIAYAGTAVAAGVIYDQTQQPEEMSGVINEMNGSLNDAQDDVTETQQTLNDKRIELVALESTALASQSALTSYIETNGQNANAASSTVMVQIEYTDDRLAELKTLQANHDATEAERQIAQTTCDSFDPPEPNDQSCLDADAAQIRVDAARQARDLKQTEVDQSTSNARTAGANYLVGNGSDVDGNPVYSPCSSVSGCNLGNQVDQVIDDQIAVNNKANEVEALEQQLSSNQSIVAELEGSIAAMNCSNEGNIYDSATQACNESTDVASGTRLDVRQGAAGSLQLIDADLMGSH